jgi:hypothetical protein
MFAVFDEGLYPFPNIRHKINELSSGGYLEYIPISPWLSDT